MQSTMMDFPLTLSHLLERAGSLYPEREIVTRLPDKSLHRYTYADFYRRSRALAKALLEAGMQPGDRVATLSWNHHAPPGGLLRRPGGRRRAPHPQPAPAPHRHRLHHSTTPRTAS